jgi:hypothetical protein
VPELTDEQLREAMLPAVLELQRMMVEGTRRTAGPDGAMLLMSKSSCEYNSC